MDEQTNKQEEEYRVGHVVVVDPNTVNKDLYKKVDAARKRFAKKHEIEMVQDLDFSQNYIIHKVSEAIKSVVNKETRAVAFESALIPLIRLEQIGRRAGGFKERGEVKTYTGGGLVVEIIYYTDEGRKYTLKMEYDSGYFSFH